MAKGVPKLLTSQEMLAGIRKRAGLPQIERRKKRRLTIEEINLMGDEQLREHLAKIREPEDKRTTFTKVMDVIDIPRNIVANIIGSLTGVKKEKLQKGALGIPRVMMSDVLNKLGVKNKVVRGVLGFVGDVAVDPLTYLTLGAATGVSIGKGLPRLLKPGARLLKATARAMTTGGKIPVGAAKALGRSPEQLLRIGGKLAAKRGAKAATKQLMARRGGLLTRTLARRAKGLGKPTAASIEAAQSFLKQFGMKGRTLLRAPFAARGLTLRRGKQARVFAELGKPETISKLMAQAGARAEVGRLGKAGARLGQKLAGVRAEVVGPLGRQAKAAQLRKLRGAKEALRLRGAEVGAGARAKMFAPEAPEILRGIVEEAGPRIVRSPQELAAMGAGPLTRAKHALIRGKRQLFGEPVTLLRQREESLRRGLVLAPREAGAAALAEYRPVVDKLLRKYVPAGLTGKRQAAKQRQVLQALTDLAEAGGKAGGELGFEGDRLRRAIEVVRRTPLARDPDTIALVEKLNTQFGAMRAKEIIAGVGRRQLPGYRPRFETKEFAALHKPEARRLVDLPVQEERVRMRAFAAPDRPRRFALTSATKEELAPLRQAGYTAGESYPISARQWNTGLNPLTGKPMSTKMIGPGTPMPQQFVTDPAEQMARRASSHQWQMGMAELRDYVMKEGTFELPQYQAAAVPHLAQPFETTESKQGALYQLLGKDLAPGGTPLMMDKPVAEMIDRLNYVVSTPEAVGKLLRGFDTAQGFWKTWALYHPGYVIRNVFQNLLGSMMAGARPVKVAQMSVSPKMRAAVRAAQAGKPIVGSISIQGRQVPLKVIFAELFKRNHVGTGLTSMLEHPTTYRRFARNIIQNKVMRLVFRLNQRVEDGMKASAYVDFLGQGMSSRQASMALAKAMPDLTMLSNFERTVMRRAMPFFSWYRRNGALQLFHYLPKYPAWAAASPKLRSAVQMAMVGDQAVDAQLRPSWQEEAQATQIMGDSEAGQVFLMGSWLPFDDMVAVLGAAESPQDFMREMLERSSPAAKFGAEMAVGVDIFRQRPIPRFTPKEFIYNAPLAIIGKSGSPLDNLLGIRPIKEYGRRVWEQPTLGGKIARGLIGGAIQPVSRERGLIARGRELRDRSQALRAKLNRAVENRDQPEIQLLTRELFRVWAQMMEQGLPGVPKAAQAMMAGRGIEAGAPAFGG